MIKKFKLLKKHTANLYIKCTLKNTLITATDSKNKVFYQTSSKSSPIKIKRKNNKYILNKISKNLIKIIKYKNKKKRLKIYMQGIGSGRYNIVKNLINKISIISIIDKTKIPFNGCRPKKQKRR